HGRSSKYEHDLVGYNFRMDDIQAAILSVKLRFLEEWTAVRRVNAALYDKLLRPAGFKVIEPPAGAVSSYHLYVVEVSNRAELQQALDAASIGHGVHYPIPAHK